MKLGLMAGLYLLVTASPLLAATRYVAAGNPGAEPPYTNWLTAAASIQPAIDAAEAGDEIVVGDGVYDTGGVAGYPLTFVTQLTNRVAIHKPVVVRSVNGPASTTILGQGPIGDSAIRCVYVADGATIDGFTLANGATHAWNLHENWNVNGGGIFGQSTNANVRNCVLTDNTASLGGGAYGGHLMQCILEGNSALSGGGALLSRMTRCLIRQNTAEESGGGTSSCILSACTLTGNIANFGGGALGGDLTSCTIVGNSALSHAGGIAYGNLYNCVVYFNEAPDEPNYDNNVQMQHSCTTPLAPGAGNIADDPLFVDLASGDFHLADGSPCINAGDNTVVTDAVDLDGNPRLDGGQVDMGAFEWQTVPTVSTTTTTSTTTTSTTTTTTSSTTAERWKAGLDFDGDGAADLGVYRPANGYWYVRQSTNGQMLAGGPLAWVAGGIPVPGDYDGDGLCDLAAFVASNGTWHILLSSTDALMAGAPVPWGWADTTPVPADYDGDGRTDLAVYWQAGGLWYIRQSRDGNLWSGAAFPFGWADTLPVPADYDGDGQADLAVFYRAGGLWYIRQSHDGALWSGAAFPWGWDTNLPVPGDYDGDGKTDLAVYEPSSGHWYVRASATGATLSGGPITWGAPAALPVPADYDGDHKTDIAVYVPATGKWYVRQSSNGLLLGGGTDVKGGVSWGHRVVHPILPAYQMLRGQGLTP